MKTLLLVLFKIVELSPFVIIAILIRPWIDKHEIIKYIWTGLVLIYLVFCWKSFKNELKAWINRNKKLINKILKK